MTLPRETPYVDITEPRREEKILPMDRLETALSRHWITSWGWVLLLGLGVVLIAVAVLNQIGGA